MKFASPPPIRRTPAALFASHALPIFLGGVLAASMAGCGGKAGTASSAGETGGSTTVTLFTTGTANDQLLTFWAGLETLTLWTNDGKQVDLLSSSFFQEFIHSNGTVEPYLTVSIPQGTYTSATATSGGIEAACDVLDSNGYDVDSNTFGNGVPGAVSVTLPAPITVAGGSMGLLLDSLVSQSATVPGNCDIYGTFSVTPTFLLTPMAISAQPTNSANGKSLGLRGMIASIGADGAGFSVSRMYDQPVGQVVTWQVSADSATAYQGVTGFSQLAVGMPADMDVAFQAGGALLATRVAVYDTNTANLTEVDAHLLNTNLSLSLDGVTTPNLLDISSITADGISEGSVPGHFPLWDYGGAVFQISGQLANVSSLPFAATFSALNMVAGQHVLATTHETLGDTAIGYSSATTITLIPQTINGTVSAISTDGEFTTYTVALAPYDLFPQFAALQNQVSALTDPSTVVVYADSNAQMLNTGPIAVGSVVRFYGLVFNDSGTLRMDCAQINDGAAE